MKTTFLKVIKQSHIFQVGTILELPEYIAYSTEGYRVPDTGDGSPGILSLDFVRRINVAAYEEPYLGKCIVTKVSNFSRGASEPKDKFGDIRPEQVRVVHYPDSQQLYFHMPQYAYDAGIFRLINGLNGEVIEETAVRNKLNGSTMILIDTLPLKPGFYTIEADWPNGWTHQIKFIKFVPEIPKTDVTGPSNNIGTALKDKGTQLTSPHTEPVSSRPESKPVVPNKANNRYRNPLKNVRIVQNDHEYRLFDSNGIEIQNGIDTRQLLKDITAKFTRTVEYHQDGRGGTITYKEGEISILLHWEFAGGNGVVIILIPEEEYWVAATKTPLNRRKDILTYVAERVIKDQVPSGRFEFYSNTISILR